MKLNIENIENALYHWVREELEGRVPADQIIFRVQSAPLPPRPCVAMRMISGPMRTGSYDDEIYDQTNDLLEISGQRTMDYSIQVFGNLAINKPLAKQIGADLSASLTKPTVLDNLRIDGIAIFSIGNIQEISSLEETEYEERVQFDIKIGVAENVEDQPGCFTSVDTIAGTYP